MKRRKLNRNALNEQYGFDFGDKVLNALGKALKRDFGKTSAIGRYVGQKFTVTLS